MARRKGQGPTSAPAARPLVGPWLDMPSLVVLVYPSSRGMHLEIVLNHHARGKKTFRETLGSVVWRPPRVNDRDVLRWANLATARALDRMLAEARKYEDSE